MSDPWLVAFNSRDDLRIFGDNALGLFALGMNFDIEDLVSVGASSITDGSDDKKCDLVYVNTDDRFAVVMQCHFSNRSRDAAPANKASDLNTAVGWLLQRSLDDLPVKLRPPAEELRSALADGDIDALHIWYVHNLPESKNVQDELKTVESTAAASLRKIVNGTGVRISALEVGQTCLASWYHDTQTPILVTDTYTIKVRNGYEVSGPSWTAYVTTIPARFLFRAFKTHKTRLFSANIRDYLGSRQSDSNINNGIKRTLRDEPESFWVYNNGVTILVNDFERPKRKTDPLVVKGISVVNGAQTTGAIGTQRAAPSATTFVQVRFVKTEKIDTIQRIVQFNNSQNKITASDFRSSDKIQKRLKEEFNNIPLAEYEGGRRGGVSDKIKRRANLLPSYTVGQALAAFHGDPVVAYNQKSDIWINGNLYSRYFCEDLTARHILFCYSLLKAIDQKKIDLVNKGKSSGSLARAEEEHLSFLRIRGSNYLLVSAVASCLETVASRSLPNLFRASFGEKVSPAEGQKHWERIVDTLLPLSTQLVGAFSNGLKSLDRVRAANQTFHSLVQVTKASNEQIYKGFTRTVLFR